MVKLKHESNDQILNKNGLFLCSSSTLLEPFETSAWSGHQRRQMSGPNGVEGWRGWVNCSKLYILNLWSIRLMCQCGRRTMLVMKLVIRCVLNFLMWIIIMWHSLRTMCSSTLAYLFLLSVLYSANCICTSVYSISDLHHTRTTNLHHIIDPTPTLPFIV